MIVIRLLRRLRGFVLFSATGIFPERFLNLLARERVHVWDIKRREHTLTGCVSASDYPRMRRPAKKAGIRLRLLEKHGVAFKKKKLKKRHGLLAGAGVFVLFVFVMTRFIWTIEVQGNEHIPQETILQVLEDIGVRPGVLRRSVNVRESEILTLLNIKELGWVALNIDGSTIYVIVNEATPTPPLVDPRTPSNIIAAETGQLLELWVYEGQPLLRKGDTVMQGQVIVSGITQDSTGKNLLRHARADVIAEVTKEIEIRVPLNQITHEKTGRTARRNYLRVFGFEAPLFLPGSIQRPYLIDRAETPWQFFGTQLPITHRSEVFTLMREVYFLYTEEQARDRALLELEIAENAQLSQAAIIERILTGALIDDEFVLSANYVAHMNIALPQEIYVS